MTIVITADLHLTSRAEHPHRFAALEDMLAQMLEGGVHTLVIAGDLFNADRRDFHEFEDIFKKEVFRAIHAVIIPGNHDAILKQSSFSLPNLLVVDQPQMFWLEKKGLPFLFLPYKPGVSAGDQMAAFRDKTLPQEFVLISHGDYVSGMRSPNPLERGVYMPLSRQDIESYQPARIFLGHTHLAFEKDRVISPGSPAAIDPSETGRRGFWLYDPITNSIERRFVRQGPIYLRENFWIYPTDVEAKILLEEINRRKNSWGLSPDEIRRVHLQATFSGCSADRSKLRNKILQILDGIQLVPNGEPDLTDVLSGDDPSLASAAFLAIQKAGGLALNDSPANPQPDEIQSSVFRLIYGA